MYLLHVEWQPNGRSDLICDGHLARRTKFSGLCGSERGEEERERERELGGRSLLNVNLQCTAI
jgi:hypothetical protein